MKPQLLLVCFLISLSFLDGVLGRTELLPYNPVANSRAVVVSGNARFTVLTPRLIRIEYATNGRFEDRATLAFVNRNLSVPSFTSGTSNGVLSITTSDLVLRYTLGRNFDQSSLTIQSTGAVKPAFSWYYGKPNPRQLFGTIRTLDMLNVISLNCTINANTPVHGESLHCEQAFFGRDGWAVVDDHDNWGLDANFWWSSPNTDQVDQYFFGSGHNYVQALSDYTQVGGKISMFPRWASGIWWSRWYNINNHQVRQIVDTYRSYQIPLDVYILDMDWHTKQEWGGYTYDTRLFPVPLATANWLHDQGLHMGANIHDDNGVASFEKMYAEMARAMGVNPSSGATIPFQVVNSTYMYSLDDIVLRDVENQGMDFWWIDWQQGGTQGGARGGKQNPTISLNKVRSTDNIRRGSDLRGLVLSRWGGLGNHRYQVGFSGDVAALTWSNLAFQPYFSFTASNVGFGFWSHDLVGPANDHELHTRWLQWGSYSGIFRTHDRGMAVGGCADSNPPTCAIIEVWNVPQMYLDANRRAMRAREELMPYIYTATRQAFDSGVSILRPLYYEFPELDLAYAGDQNGNYAQYLFGDDVMVAPVVVPADTTTSLAPTTVWVPPGQWVEKDTGYVHTGNANGNSVLSKSYDLSEIPVFYRAGAIVPAISLDGDVIGIAGRQPTTLVFYVYPGTTDGSTRVYEDDGQTTDYLEKQYAYTTVSYVKTSSGTQSKLTLTIATEGRYQEFPTARDYIIRLVNHLPPQGGQVNGHNLAYSSHGGASTWRYDGPELTTVIETGILPTNAPVTITVTTAQQTDLSGFKGMIAHSNLAKETLDQTNETPGTSSTNGGYLDQSASTGDLLSYLAGADINKFYQTINAYPALFQQALAEVQNLKPVPNDALVQLWNDQRQDNCLCATSDCFNSNSDYTRLRIEGYQPAKGTPGTKSLNDFWSARINDNYATTQSTTPAGYSPAVFSDGVVFENQVAGTVSLQLYWNEQRKDMLTVASEEGIQYAHQYGYTLVNANLGYVYSKQPTTIVGLTASRWARAIALMNNAYN